MDDYKSLVLNVYPEATLIRNIDFGYAIYNKNFLGYRISSWCKDKNKPWKLAFELLQIKVFASLHS